MDRNNIFAVLCNRLAQSLSARRAWIEILAYLLSPWVFLVALRKESVDRNKSAKLKWPVVMWSLSARRAWIEILQYSSAAISALVALRKESVDRNSIAGHKLWDAVTVALRKESVDRNSNLLNKAKRLIRSLSARRAWIEIWLDASLKYSPHSRSPQGERG